MTTSAIDSSRIKKTVVNMDSFIDSIQCSYHDTVMPPARKIVALGDIHGDFEALIYCLYGAGLINQAGHWIGRDTVVVQTGDILDDCRYAENKPSKCHNDFPVEGYDELVILEYLADLNQQALRTGGKVVLCMGNHELMAIMNSPFSDKYIQHTTREYYQRRRNEFLKPGSRLAKKLACIMNVVAFVGEWAFLHGGLRPSAFENLEDIKIANMVMRAYLEGELMPSDEKQFLESIDDNWFMWDREYSKNMLESDTGRLCNEFIQIRRMLGMPKLRMVVGHSPQHVINSICDIDGKPAIYRIDTSMSRAFGSKHNPAMRVHALVIRGDRISSVSPMYIGKEFIVPNSLQYVDYVRSKKYYESPHKDYQPVLPKSERLARQLSERQRFLEAQENTDLDDAFIYEDTHSV